MPHISILFLPHEITVFIQHGIGITELELLSNPLDYFQCPA